MARSVGNPRSSCARLARGAAIAAILALVACVSEPSLDRGALEDPASCEGCHPDHVREWAGSMHAYASDDPVFLALNQLLQDQTDGAFADFCVGCHAPMAVRTGATVDGTNLEEVPRHLRGVTCYFCHSVASVEGDHNNALALADDGVMRGPFEGARTGAHDSAYSPLLDGRRLESASMCGACHDVVTPAGVHLERTFAEWKGSVFAQPGPQALSCNRCHMPGRDGPGAAVAGAPQRRLHEHGWPGIDVALTPWPGVDAQLAGIERDLEGAVHLRLCVGPGAGATEVTVTLDNVFAGHAFPSGVTHARRAWVEVRAFAGDRVVFESGVVEPGQAVHGRDDPYLWSLSSRLFDARGDEVELSWQAASVESELLPPSVTNDPTDPRFFHAVTRSYPVATVPDRVTARLRVRPVGLEIIDLLIDDGRLAPAVRDRIPTLELEPSMRTWSAATGFGCVPE